ncbi:restriction endonuclease subunit S [Pseudoalteromonas aurantia]|uniref:Type I restriction modification DNA specificity domain-containing protein n=1 Tax=Pseudoalteromonas aurantia TaxID=43654 RepID=A0A5S3V7N8_9GAMM|nr:restriction endonuclease subunit S [Pseudoalteromonas aurantia]TMO67870.1 hypothetical protein CWC19_12335 [Pseudoalteromonas aurantia]
MVPNGWTLNNFNSVAELIHGFQFREHHFSESGVPIVKIASISHLRGVSLEKCSYISEEIASEFSKYQIEAGDVLMALTGGTLGKTCKVQEDIEICLQNYRVGNFKPKASFLDKDFLYYFLISFTVQKKIENIVNEAAQPNVGKADFDKIKVLTPPLPEQRKIAKILGTWDKAISTTERLIDNSKQQKKALMQHLLTGAHTQRKRLLDDSGKPFEGEWEEIEVGDLGTIYSGGTPSTTNKAYWDGEIDWITPTDITKQDSVYIKSSVRKISSEGLKNSSAKLVPKGSLLVCTRATIGEMAITAHEMCTNQGFKNIIPNKKTNIEFLFYLLTYQKHKLVSKASGSTFLELSKSAFESMKFRVPVIDEQQKIASVLTNADREIEVLEQQLADLKHEKKALMQQLLTGKRRVKI